MLRSLATHPRLIYGFVFLQLGRLLPTLWTPPCVNALSSAILPKSDRQE